MRLELSKILPAEMLSDVENELTQDLPGLLESVKVDALSLDSRTLTDNTLFFAIPSAHSSNQNSGQPVDGRQFIADALDKGATCVLAEVMPAGSMSANLCINSLTEAQQKRVIWVSGVKKWMPEISNRFFGEPSHQIKLLGVTGTNGKTTCTYLIAQLLDEFGCGLMGTLGTGDWQHLKPSVNTTRDLLSIQHDLLQMADQGKEYVAMEVSSHALDQGRVDGLTFDTVLYTNLSQDHLDYHKTLSAYAAAKQKLFEFPELKRAVFNLADPVVLDTCKKIYELRSEEVEIWGYSSGLEPYDILPIQKQVWLAEGPLYTESGIALTLVIAGEPLKLTTPLIGAFNIENLMAVLALLTSLGIEPEKLVKCCSQLQPPPGRMQKLNVHGAAHVIIDYAHTPAGLKAALGALKPLCSGQLWCVFGCGGERDIEKRGLMGQAASEFADRIILTADNSRSEPTENIIADICSRLTPEEKSRLRIEEDRRAAIYFALREAKLTDWVLIAGKGHEDTQIINGKTIFFSDQAVVESYFASLAEDGRADRSAVASEGPCN